MPEFEILRTVLAMLRSELRGGTRGERGMTTETVIITAVLAALAIAVTTIIVTRVRGRAEEIPVE